MEQLFFQHDSLTARHRRLPTRQQRSVNLKEMVHFRFTLVPHTIKMEKIQGFYQK